MNRLGYEILNVQLGDARYEDLVGQIRHDVHLRAQMWADAEHRIEEHPDKIWFFVLAGRVPAAWCAARVVGQELVCSDNYERGEPTPGRREALYQEVYAERHRTLVEPVGLAAVTYLFPGRVVELHEADGWQQTGVSGPGQVEGHTWVELRWLPSHLG